MLSKAELNAIKKRVEKATPCPWVFNGSEIVSEHIPNTGIAGAITDEDCEFIAHAREDVPKLIAEVERLREAIIEAIADIETISPHEAQKTLRKAIK